jgi:uncharacterized coiled-coil protein SlyX
VGASDAGADADAPVAVQVHVGTTPADVKASNSQNHPPDLDPSSTAAAAAATIAEQQQQQIAELQGQVAELQERLDSTQRERSSFYSRLASARSVIAAARCSTPSSLLSVGSGVVSPQPSFSALEPVFGVSVCVCVGGGAVDTGMAIREHEGGLKVLRCGWGEVHACHSVEYFLTLLPHQSASTAFGRYTFRKVVCVPPGPQARCLIKDCI